MPKARRILSRLLSTKGGWTEITCNGSHHKLEREGKRVMFSYHDSEELGTTQLQIIAKQFGYTLEELSNLL
jgi:predicted RNA binding protein YcfA (HicA-like mRNA interferase family)